MERNRRRVIVGKVIKKVLDKTCTVLVERDVLHPLYKKRIKKSKKFLVHDPENIAQVNDIVEIMETRPISKRKHFRLHKILQKGVTVDNSEQGE